jgi:hypothetical protein
MDPPKCLLPLLSRPVADILIGIMTIRQNGKCIWVLLQHTEEYLSDKFPMVS